MSSFHFYYYNQFKIIPLGRKLFRWAVRSVQKPTQIFGNFRCPILSEPRTPLQLPGFLHGRKADLNWKLKISITAVNADTI